MKASLGLLALVLLCAVAAVQGARPLLQAPPEPTPPPTPIVMWHGMGDNCCDPLTMGHLQRFVEAALPGVYVRSIMVGDNTVEDTMHGFFGNVNSQVEEACQALAADPQLAGGFNAVGFSQGGQFLRALVQRCGGGNGTTGSGLLKVKQLITLGGQHQGVSATPGCDTLYSSSSPSAAASSSVSAAASFDSAASASSASLFCRAAEAAINTAVYSRYTRSSVVQAQYFKDPAQYPNYLKFNPFLPDVNNELELKNEVYKANLMALERLVLIRFTEDTTVVPRDSSWFSTYAPGGGGTAGEVLVPLREQALYTEDWLGLKALDERGALVMSDCPGAHMQFSDAWFTTNVIDKYLRGGVDDVVLDEGVGGIGGVAWVAVDVA